LIGSQAVLNTLFTWRGMELRLALFCHGVRFLSAVKFIILCNVLQDIFEQTVNDAEILPVDPPRDDWLAHKVCFCVFHL